MFASDIRMWYTCKYGSLFSRLKKREKKKRTSDKYITRHGREWTDWNVVVYLCGVTTIASACGRMFRLVNDMDAVFVGDLCLVGISWKTGGSFSINDVNYGYS